eukprot:jgi/Undpi1/9873/HiC_scaffold_28.g12327.m1
MSLWKADELNRLSDELNWASKDTLKPVGTFDADYAALCRNERDLPTSPAALLIQGVPLTTNNTNNTNEDEKTSVVTDSAKKPSVHFRNFTVDNTTLRLTLEALKRSSDIDTLIFHNAGLTQASISTLVEGLPCTSIRSLGLDYNYNRLKAESKEEDGLDEALLTGSSSPRNVFADLVREGSKLKALSLRGNGLGDDEAIAISEAIEENTVLCSLNLFDNAITDNGAEALAKALRLNTALRGLSLARNRLTAVSAETFGLLLAGGYEVLPAEIQKRAEAESKIAAQNKIAQDAMKKKKDANVETRQPLSVVFQGEDGRSVAGGSRSLAALNLADNRDLGAGGALAGLLMRIVDARKREVEEGGGGGAGGGGAGGAVVLRELHLMRCQGDASEGEGEGEEGGGGVQAGLIAAASFELRPTKVIV